MVGGQGGGGGSAVATVGHHRRRWPKASLLGLQHLLVHLGGVQPRLRPHVCPLPGSALLCRTLVAPFRPPRGKLASAKLANSASQIPMTSAAPEANAGGGGGLADPK